MLALFKSIVPLCNNSLGMGNTSYLSKNFLPVPSVRKALLRIFSFHDRSSQITNTHTTAIASRKEKTAKYLPLGFFKLFTMTSIIYCEKNDAFQVSKELHQKVSDEDLASECCKIKVLREGTATEKKSSTSVSDVVSAVLLRKMAEFSSSLSDQRSSTLSLPQQLEYVQTLLQERTNDDSQAFSNESQKGEREVQKLCTWGFEHDATWQEFCDDLPLDETA